MSHFLALDQSTSATKALVCDQEGRPVAQAGREHASSFPQPGWVEQDAEEIWRNTLEVLRTAAGRAGVPDGEIACLSLANQRETIVVFERGTGRPLHPAIVWQCRRGAELCSAQDKAGREPAIRARTGLRLDPYFSASKIQWLVQRDPELRRRLEGGGALLGTIDAYLIYRLTRQSVFATDHTNASRTLLYDIRRLRWDEELCAWWDVPPAALPEIRESSDEFGATDLDGALSRPIPIRGVMGDSQAALFALAGYAPGFAKVTLGTGSSLLVGIGSRFQASEHGVLTALAGVYRGRPSYAFEGLIISAASALAWLRNNLGLIADYGESEAIASGLADTGGVYLVPAFSGLGFPHWAPGARAAITGLSSHSDRRHLIRAALESIAYQVRDALDAIRSEAGIELRSLQVDGGPTANKFLMQFLADLTGIELRAASAPDRAARGAMRAGRLGLGLAAEGGISDPAPAGDQIYRPSMPAGQVEVLRQGWSRAVRQTLSQL
ncbi:MAG: glycerol kinase GlpK [Opitutaceae bacterium]|jgi:glycerol kinase